MLLFFSFACTEFYVQLYTVACKMLVISTHAHNNNAKKEAGETELSLCAIGTFNEVSLRFEQKLLFLGFFLFTEMYTRAADRH